MLAAGKHHGTGPLEAAAHLFKDAVAAKRDATIVAEALKSGKRLPGYGHRVYNGSKSYASPPESPLFGYYDGHVRLAVEIEAELEKQKGKLCLNVDGAIAAIACALGIPVNVQLVFSSLPEPLACDACFEEMAEKPARQRKRPLNFDVTPMNALQNVLRTLTDFLSNLGGS